VTFPLATFIQTRIGLGVMTGLGKTDLGFEAVTLGVSNQSPRLNIMTTCEVAVSNIVNVMN
jgi:hypothetical protein